MFENWRKKNEEIKGQISSSSLILVYMIHLPTVHVCTKLQSSRPLSMCVSSFNFLGLTVPEKSVTKNFHLKDDSMTE